VVEEIGDDSDEDKTTDTAQQSEKDEGDGEGDDNSNDNDSRHTFLNHGCQLEFEISSLRRVLLPFR